LEAAVERGRILAESQNFSRAMVNEPANLLTPLAMADAAGKMAAEFGLECELLDRAAMEKLGMGSLLGVAIGSAEPPVLIVLKYRPGGAAQGSAHLGLVGKGVTFDTGGISIKPADGMEKMKYDMAGGAAMIGAMRAIAQLKPAIPVTGFVPCVENMPGSRAQRPGDIVKAMNGKTIEVINTDAEGRLILADALVYARRQGCTHLVDAATLTGAIVVHAPGGRRHADRCGGRGAGTFECRTLRQRRPHARPCDGGGQGGGRAHVAASAGGRLQGLPEERIRGYRQRGWTLWRRRDGGSVPEGILGRYSLGASGYRRHCVARRA